VVKHKPSKQQGRYIRAIWIVLFIGGQASSIGLTVPSQSGINTNSQASRASHVFKPQPQRTPVAAIVQLRGLQVPEPQTQGQASLPLSALPGTAVYTLNAKLKGLPTRWLVDTGASTSMVATSVVTALNLKGQSIPNQRLAFAVAGNDCPNMNATLHSLPKLQLQGAQVEGLQGLQFASTTIPAGLSGVLGMDVLSQFDLSLHPGKSELRLLPPTPLPADEIAQAIPLEKKLGVMVAQLKINGQGPFRVLLDTAADSTFISKKVADQLQLPKHQMQPLQIRGFCGLEQAMRSQLTTITLHHHQRQNLDTIILSSSILKVLEVDGILGQNFLRHYHQYWRFNTRSGDQERGSLVLVPITPHASPKN